MSRNLAEYPITQEEVVMHLAVAASSAHRDAGIGDLRPMILEHVTNTLSAMTPEEWAKFSEGLNP